jgi:hypothetical protein
MKTLFRFFSLNDRVLDDEGHHIPAEIFHANLTCRGDMKKRNSQKKSNSCGMTTTASSSKSWKRKRKTTGNDRVLDDEGHHIPAEIFHANLTCRGDKVVFIFPALQAEEAKQPEKVEFMWDDYHRQQLEELEAEEEDDLLQPERQGSR